MATNYNLQPVQGTIHLNDSGKTTVSFRITRSGDTSFAETLSWDTWDDSQLHRDGGYTNYKAFEAIFFSPDAYPSGTVSFAAYETTKTFSLSLDEWPDSGDLSFAVRIKPTVSGTILNESASGGVGVTEKHYTISSSGGVLNLNYDMYGIPDRADLYVNNVARATTGGQVSGTGTLTPGIALNAGDDIKVVITGTDSGTAWDYTVSYTGGLSSNTNIFATQIVDTGRPSIADLARLSSDVYSATGIGANGWTAVQRSAKAGFQGVAYRNAASSEVVVAFRGTELNSGDRISAKNAGADLSFANGVLTPSLARDLVEGVRFIQQVVAANPSAHITLTGHSLGGALAQMIGGGSGYSSVGFDAPGGGGGLFLQALPFIAPIYGKSNEFSSSNYRLAGDQVSLIGSTIGAQYTVSSPPGFTINPLNFLENHDINALKNQLIADQHEQENGIPPPQGDVQVVAGVPDITQYFVPYLQKAIVPKLLGTPVGRAIYLATYVADAVAEVFFDPSTGKTFIFTENAGSPLMQSITLPSLDRVAYYTVQYQVGGSWSSPHVVLDNARYTFGVDASGVKFEAFDTAGHHILIPSSFVFAGTYASGGTVTGTFNVLDGSPVGPFGKFDTNGDGKSDMLWRNDAGAVGVWDMNGSGIASAATLAAPGNDWHIVGTGDFNGDGRGDIAWRNDNGALSIWQLNGTTIIPAANAGMPDASWHVAGIGDFNGDHKSDILWRQDGGTVGVWLMNGAQIASGGNAGAPDNSWNIISTADFNGDGKSDILWRTDSGTVGVWLMNGAQIAGGANVGSPDNSYYFSGAGDFNGDGKADILWRNTDGAAAIWLMNGTQIQGASTIGTPGNTWHVERTGDFNADGKTDILWRNDDGTVGTWLMNGTSILSGANTGAPDNNWQITGTGDFNGDGKTDLSWLNQDTGVVGVWLMNGTQILAGGNPASLGPEWQNYQDHFAFV